MYVCMYVCMYVYVTLGYLMAITNMIAMKVCVPQQLDSNGCEINGKLVRRVYMLYM